MPNPWDQGSELLFVLSLCLHGTFLQVILKQTLSPAPSLRGEGAGLHPAVRLGMLPAPSHGQTNVPSLAGLAGGRRGQWVCSSCAAHWRGGSLSSSNCVWLVQCSSHKLDDFKETIISSTMVSSGRPRHSSEFTRVNKRTISQLCRYALAFSDLPFYRREVQVSGVEELNALRQTPSLDVQQDVAAGQPALYPRGSI